MIKCTGLYYSICHPKQKSRDNKLAVLESKLSQLESHLPNQTAFFDDFEQQIFEIKREIAEIVKYKTRAAVIGCRSQWVEEGEKPTGYYLGLEKRLHNQKTLKAIIIDDGRRITHYRRVLEEQQHFYETFYKSRFEELSPVPNYLDNLNLPQLSEEERLILEEPIVKEEIIEAIKVMNNGRATRFDGYPTEFFKKFLPILSDFLVNLYEEVLREDLLHL